LIARTTTQAPGEVTPPDQQADPQATDIGATLTIKLDKTPSSQAQASGIAQQIAADVLSDRTILFATPTASASAKGGNWIPEAASLVVGSVVWSGRTVTLSGIYPRSQCPQTSKLGSTLDVACQQTIHVHVVYAAKRAAKHG
jgi:hypothetical protein